MTTTVYDMKGNTVKVVNEVPLNEIMPKGFSSVRTGKRYDVEKRCSGNIGVY
jgi:hypothetical protein